MKAQWSLQKQILNRTRALGMVGQLPAFQAAVPSTMIDLLKDSNMTDNGQVSACCLLVAASQQEPTCLNFS